MGPLFSVAATGGVMAAQAGRWALPAIAIQAVHVIISSFIFRLLGRHFPHAGASYHWPAPVIGKGVSRYQAPIPILAYFLALTPSQVSLLRIRIGGTRFVYNALLGLVKANWDGESLEHRNLVRRGLLYRKCHR